MTCIGVILIACLSTSKSPVILNMTKDKMQLQSFSLVDCIIEYFSVENVALRRSYKLLVHDINQTLNQ